MTPPDRLTRDIPLGPDALLRISAVPDARGTLLKLRVHRASPADRSEDRFRPNRARAVPVPIAALKRLESELARVARTAMELEFWRPLSSPDA